MSSLTRQQREFIFIFFLLSYTLFIFAYTEVCLIIHAMSNSHWGFIFTFFVLMIFSAAIFAWILFSYSEYRREDAEKEAMLAAKEIHEL